ncbi:hypothetical protein DOTSEDRAFT_50786 [Dothistroma septosporum NZE10]|uniref:L-dopachrome isomerase n=1 Tax=Dothistroma septosporum (strain NZE10 / CBS 128990) TaxID=675120 RepID=N1PV68_DOTSN|nr:hypothetical protein DOTSEDRAFT_50786 [Dothistroma septosporum NZE10]
MPHSTSGPGDSTSTTHSSDLLSPLPKPSFLNIPAVAVPYSNQSSSRSQARNRASLPGPDIVADLLGKTDVDDFMQKHLGDRNSMIATYNSSSKHRLQYYDEPFQQRGNGHGGIRERVQRESPVVAELRTNVIIKDEFTLVTDLSYHLAARYSRPDSCVMVKVDHSACLALGGTFDPCYMLTITTVPSQMGPTTNKRNAALIQSFMADILSVAPERGIIKFEAIPEDNYAINGTTILGEIERQEKQQSSDAPNSVRRAISNGRKNIPSFKKSLPKLNTDSKPTGPQSTESRSAHPDMESSTSTANRRKSTPNPTAAADAMNGVFELPAIELDRKPPSTAHSQAASAGSNGLRMNGVSDADLTPQVSRSSSSDRPKTISGGIASVPAKTKPPVNGAPTSQSRYSAQQLSRGNRPPSFLKVDPTKRSSRPNSANKSGSPDEVKSKPRESYVDGVMAAAATKGKRASVSRSTLDFDVKKEPTANTAKRRSTITATPKMPTPPPVPDTTDSKSTRSMKKRKSFMSAFRRSTAAAS